MFNIQENLNVVMVLLEGIFSFFSPCVIPLLPIYMGYLASSQKNETKSQRKVFFLTLLFVLGIFTAIFIFHFIMTLLHSMVQDSTIWITRIAGVLIILLGIYQFGFFKINSIEKTRRLKWKKRDMNAGGAFLLGFVFSFAWTPCFGPALTSILLFANSADTFMNGTFYVLLYALGFGIPFVILGAFTQRFLRWLSTHKNVMKYTVKAGAIIMVFIGLFMIINTVKATPVDNGIKEETVRKDDQSVQFTLPDQNGNKVSIKDAKGKVVFLNFWATWCTPCKDELPHVQELYEKYKDSDEVAIYTVVNLLGEPSGQQGVMQFINDMGLDIPVLYDSGSVSQTFGIGAYPTTYMLDAQGNVFGYVKGALDKEMMESIINQTITGKKE